MISNRGNGGGSGAYIGNRLVITCDHLFRDGRTGAVRTGRVVVSFPDGQASEARVVRQDAQWDLAVLELSHEPRGVQPICLADKLPVRGDTLHVGGFGGVGNVRFLSGRLSGFGRAKRSSSGPADTLIVQGAHSRGGDSGGPVLNDRGCLAGVLWGSGGGDTVGTQIGRCRLFLRGLFRPSKSLKVTPKLPKVVRGKPGPPGVQGETGPPGPIGSPGKSSDVDRELQLAVQANAAAIAALTRHIDLIAKGQKDLSLKIRETQITNQDILVLVQRNAKAIEINGSPGGTPADINKLIERINQLEKKIPASYEIVAGKPKPGE